MPRVLAGPEDERAGRRRAMGAGVVGEAGGDDLLGEAEVGAEEDVHGLRR